MSFSFLFSCFFFFNDPAPTEIYTLSLHDALPISVDRAYHHAGKQNERRDRVRNPPAPKVSDDRRGEAYPERGEVRKRRRHRPPPLPQPKRTPSELRHRALNVVE